MSETLALKEFLTRLSLGESAGYLHNNYLYELDRNPSRYIKYELSSLFTLTRESLLIPHSHRRYNYDRKFEQKTRADLGRYTIGKKAVNGFIIEYLNAEPEDLNLPDQCVTRVIHQSNHPEPFQFVSYISNVTAKNSSIPFITTDPNDPNFSEEFWLSPDSRLQGETSVALDRPRVLLDLVHVSEFYRNCIQPFSTSMLAVLGE